MSQLRLYNTRWGTRNLNILSFTSPITGQIPSAQARTLIHHFPIRALQPELELEVVFRGEREYEDFQLWVRNVQIDAQTNAISPGVTIWWPQRSIYNWTGVIKNFRAGGARGNYVPRAKFVIDLIDSMVSARTTLSSFGTPFQEIYSGSVITDVTEAPLIPPPPIDSTPSSPDEPADSDNLYGPIFTEGSMQ